MKWAAGRRGQRERDGRSRGRTFTEPVNRPKTGSTRRRNRTLRTPLWDRPLLTQIAPSQIWSNGIQLRIPGPRRRVNNITCLDSWHVRHTVIHVRHVPLTSNHGKNFWDEISEFERIGGSRVTRGLLLRSRILGVGNVILTGCPPNCVEVSIATWWVEHPFTGGIQTRQYRCPEVILSAEWGNRRRYVESSHA